MPTVISKVPYCFFFLFCNDPAAVGNSLIQQEIDLLKVLGFIYLLIYDILAVPLPFFDIIINFSSMTITLC